MQLRFDVIARKFGGKLNASQDPKCSGGILVSFWLYLEVICSNLMHYKDSCKSFQFMNGWLREKKAQKASKLICFFCLFVYFIPVLGGKIALLKILHDNKIPNILQKQRTYDTEMKKLSQMNIHQNVHFFSEMFMMPLKINPSKNIYLFSDWIWEVKFNSVLTRNVKKIRIHTFLLLWSNVKKIRIVTLTLSDTRTSLILATTTTKKHNNESVRIYERE